jgi:lysophospholipase L1-like esterase
MKICVFGDSITYAGYINNGWVSLLRPYLEEKLEGDTEFFNLGINGNTSEDILRRFKFECTPRQPNTIIFAYGINDSSYVLELKKCLVEIEDFRKNTQKLIDEAKEFTDNVAFIGLVLGDENQLKPYHESSRGKKVFDRNRSKMYDQTLKEIAEKNGCKYIYLFDKLEFPDFIDGLHPNENGHKKMFEVIKGYFY